LRGNKNAKGKQDYVYLLEEAFAKAKERDLRNIETWSQDANPANLEKIFNAYINLNNRQELIRPLLPLKLLNEGRDAIFPMENYSTEIVNSKNALSNYLYTSSKNEKHEVSEMPSHEIIIIIRDYVEFYKVWDEYKQPLYNHDRQYMENNSNH
jgi:hypothetical protein